MKIKLTDFCFTWQPNQILISNDWEDKWSTPDLSYQFSVIPKFGLSQEIYLTRIYNGQEFSDREYNPQVFFPNKENCTHIGCLAKLRLHVTLSKESKGKLIGFNCKITRPQWKYEKKDYLSTEELAKIMYENTCCGFV